MTSEIAGWVILILASVGVFAVTNFLIGSIRSLYRRWRGPKKGAVEANFYVYGDITIFMAECGYCGKRYRHRSNANETMEDTVQAGLFNIRAWNNIHGTKKHGQCSYIDPAPAEKEYMEPAEEIR